MLYAVASTLSEVVSGVQHTPAALLLVVQHMLQPGGHDAHAASVWWSAVAQNGGYCEMPWWVL
jgi:hypothetical protein